MSKPDYNVRRFETIGERITATLDAVAGHIGAVNKPANMTATFWATDRIAFNVCSEKLDPGVDSDRCDMRVQIEIEGMVDDRDDLEIGTPLTNMRGSARDFGWRYITAVRESDTFGGMFHTPEYHGTLLSREGESAAVFVDTLKFDYSD